MTKIALGNIVYFKRIKSKVTIIDTVNKKKFIPGLSRTKSKFQDFLGLSRTVATLLYQDGTLGVFKNKIGPQAKRIKKIFQKFSIKMV